jgi:hypothetical protein
MSLGGGGAVRGTSWTKSGIADAGYGMTPTLVRCPASRPSNDEECRPPKQARKAQRRTRVSVAAQPTPTAPVRGPPHHALSPQATPWAHKIVLSEISLRNVIRFRLHPRATNPGRDDAYSDGRMATGFPIMRPGCSHLTAGIGHCAAHKLRERVCPAI